MKTKLIIACLVLGSWAANAQHDHAGHGAEKKTDQSMVMFKDATLGKAYEHYLHLKDALVASNQDEAKKAAGELQKSLANVKNSKMVADEVAKVTAAADLNSNSRSRSQWSARSLFRCKRYDGYVSERRKTFYGHDLLGVLPHGQQ